MVKMLKNVFTYVKSMYRSKIFIIAKPLSANISESRHKKDKKIAKTLL